MTPRRCLDCTRIIPTGSRCPNCEKRRVAAYDRNHRRARILAIVKAGYRCERCGSRKKLHAHHRIPLRDGGSNTPENYIILCRVCHPTVERGEAA